MADNQLTAVNQVIFDGKLISNIDFSKNQIDLLISLVSDFDLSFAI